MKIGKLFLTAVVALGLMACNNEEVPQIEGAESTISIKVFPSSDSPSFRAVGDLSEDDVNTVGLEAESLIKQLEVYLFYGEAVKGYESATHATNVTEVTGIKTTTGPTTIVVVANAGIGQVANKAELLAKTKYLPADITKGLPMTGMTDADVIVAPGQNYYGYAAGKTPAGKEHSVAAPLQIVRVNARVAITSATLNLTAESIFNELKDVDVAMFNVPKISNIFGDAGSLAINADYLFGEAWPSPQTSYTVGTANTYFKDATVTFPIKSTNAPYYYVTENTVGKAEATTNQRMLIVLRGKPYKDGVAVVVEGLYTDAAGYTYYPVWVNADDKGYTYPENYTADNFIKRNTQYNISLSITKIGNPTIDPVQNAFMDVTVTVAPWTVVTQNVTW